LRCSWAMPVFLVGCMAGFRGEDGFVVGRAQLIPCVDRDDAPGALLFIESQRECWDSFGMGRPSCEDRRRAVQENRGFCSPGVVIDSPSVYNLSTFLGPPIDVRDYRGAGSVVVRNLPCNPRGPFADGYPDWEEQLQIFEGEVLVTEDRGRQGRIEVELYRPGREVPAMQGWSVLEICR
jgi:hypothetical protein